jgi:hypothetical protein
VSCKYLCVHGKRRPPLWPEFLATDPEVRVQFPALPDFLRSGGSGTGSTQPREYNWGATWRNSSGSGLESREYGSRDPPRWPRDTFHPQKLALASPTSGGRSVDTVRSRTQPTEFNLVWREAHRVETAIFVNECRTLQLGVPQYAESVWSATQSKQEGKSRQWIMKDKHSEQW